MPCIEAAAKWGIFERRVQKLCEAHGVLGAEKFSYVWLISNDAEEPVAGKEKENNFSEKVCKVSGMKKSYR